VKYRLLHLSYSSEAVISLDYQLLLKSHPLKLLTGYARAWKLHVALRTVVENQWRKHIFPQCTCEWTICAVKMVRESVIKKIVVQCHGSSQIVFL